MAKTRDSNIELMRLICLIMITIHHRIVFTISKVPIILDGQGEIDYLTAINIIVNAFCYIGVNCFVLISGYYGINLKWKKLYGLCVACTFYMLIRNLLVAGGIIDDNFFSIRNLLMPLTSNTYWFITDYVILCLLSPILNKAIQNLKKKEFLLILFAFTIANIYFGYGFLKYNSNGHNVSQFVYLYLIAAYIRRYVKIQEINRNYSLYIYILASLAFGILSIISHYYHIPKFRSFAYNNPLLLVSSISFLLYMLSFRFQNNIINWMASSALAIYLIPGRLLYDHFYYPNVYCPLINKLPEGIDCIFLLFSLIIPAIYFAIFAVCFDKLRLYVINPIAFKIYNIITEKVRPVYYKIFYE